MARNDKRVSRGKSTSAARLAAVQGLYEIDLSGASVDSVLMDFVQERWTGRLADEELAPPDKKKFSALIQGVSAEGSRLDDMIKGALDKKQNFDRLDHLLRAILRAGAFEIFHQPKVPARVILNEYVDLTHAFYSEKEPALVNGILDRLAKIRRPDELEKRASE